MKFIKWFKSLFIPTECLVVEKPKKKDTVRELLDKGISSFEIHTHLAHILHVSIINAHAESPLPNTADMEALTCQVVEEFKEQYPDINVSLIENHLYRIEISLCVNDKEEIFRFNI